MIRDCEGGVGRHGFLLSFLALDFLWQTRKSPAGGEAFSFFTLYL